MATGSSNSFKGLISLLYPQQNIDLLPIPPDMKNFITAANVIWPIIHPTCKLTMTEEKGHAYGEPTFGAMAKICSVIKSELEMLNKPITPDDIFLDWGAGAGRWLIFVKLFLGDLICLGIECDSEVYKICNNNLTKAQVVGFGHRSKVLWARSESFECFCPVRIFYNYDGGAQKTQATAKGTIHPTLMRAAFSSPSVDVIVSTRTSLTVFCEYFENQFFRLGNSVWKAVRLPPQSMGGSSFRVTSGFG